MNGFKTYQPAIFMKTKSRYSNQTAIIWAPNTTWCGKRLQVAIRLNYKTPHAFQHGKPALRSAAIEIPVSYLEGVAAEKRAEAEARIKIIKRSTDQIAQQMEVDPEYARRAVKKFGQRVIREQANPDMVSAIVAGELKETTNAINQQIDGGSEKTINDDWLNHFEKEAKVC